MIEKIKKEIQRQLQEAEERLSHINARGFVAPNEEQLIVHLKGLLSFIDTLEVKEADLEKELDSMITPELKLHKALPSLFDVAKHFFELGLCNTITEEDCKLIWNIGDEIPNMPEEEFFKELLKRYKAQKGE